MGTMDTLVEDLLRKPRDPFRDELVKRALAGTYHDFKSESPFPKVQLVLELERYGYRDIARKAKAGDYDDSPDGDDSKAFGELLARRPELAVAWEEMKKTNDPAEALAILLRVQQEGGL